MISIGLGIATVLGGCLMFLLATQRSVIAVQDRNQSRRHLAISVLAEATSLLIVLAGIALVVR
jgi:hypothetical protein